MSGEGLFEIEEADIARLAQDGAAYGRSGWVNVGTHAVRIQLDDDGNLSIEVNARTNEADALAELHVTKSASLAAGGFDPDED